MDSRAESSFQVTEIHRDKDGGDSCGRVSRLVRAAHGNRVEASLAGAQAFGTEIGTQRAGDYPVCLVASIGFVAIVPRFVRALDVRKLPVVLLGARLSTLIRFVAGNRNDRAG